MLDYRIETFLAVCEKMNYREVAEMLHITQPAVTHHIQFLEKEYGCRLFSYEKRRLIKSDAAVLLEEYARAMRRGEQALREKMRRNGARKLRVGATKTIGDFVITEQIQRCLRREEVDLTLIVDNTEHLLRLLEANELDFAIVEGYFDKRHFDSRCLRKEPFVGICRKGHPFAGREIGMRELLGETIIHREAGSGTRAILEEKLRAHNESLSRFRRQICISSFKQILNLVREGMGISFVYGVLADSDPGIDRFTVEGESIVREFNLVYLKHDDVQEAIDLFFS